MGQARISVREEIMKNALRSLCAVTIACVVAPASVWGAEAAPPPETRIPTEAQALAELEAFVDGVMADQMMANHFVGATFAMVMDGEVVLKKGYGYADFEKRAPVDPDTTLFRPGSASKLFTWTAVMQLYERGKIDLDADVNTYLTEFKIPDTFPEPITMKHLMSHTPGFEEISGGIWAHEVAELVPLGEQLKRKLPERIWPPGQVTAYSNYGTALAGYIVELVSGMPFEDYIEQNILEPLGMEYTTFRQPLPQRLAAHMSVGYARKNGVYEPKEFELVNGIGPAGCASSSAVDMAKFAIAHLQKGRYGENRILEEETAELMHSRLFSHDPRIWGNAHGFWEHDLNGQRIIEHGGDTLWFHSFFALLPEQNVGFFLSYNTAGGRGFEREDFLQALLDRYDPVPPVKILTPPADFEERAGRFTGAYAMNRAVYSKYTKVMRLVGAINVVATDRGTLMIKLPAGLGAFQLVEIAPLLFRDIEGPGLFAFREDANGRITHGFMGQLPHMAVEKLAWYETPALHYFLLVLCVLLFLTAFRWPLKAVAGRICGTTSEEPAGSTSARAIVVILCAINLIFLVWFVAMHASAMDQMIYGYPSGIRLVLTLPLISIAFLIASVVYMVQAWRKRYWSVCARLHFTLVVAAGLCFLWFLNFWNLVGYKL
jgi:CubicO group peptidase (beta-lactamase class C family)